MSNFWLKHCRQPDLYEESPASSEYSTGSTLMPYTATDKTEKTPVEIGALHEDIPNELQSVHVKEQSDIDECEKESISCANMSQGY